MRENQIERVENLVVEPKNFNNYHNSIVINLTVNVTGDTSDAGLAKIHKTATERLKIELKEILKTNFDGEGKAEKTTYQLAGNADTLADLLTEINPKVKLEQKSTFCLIAYSHHFEQDNLTMSQVLSLCSQISKMQKS